MAMKKFTCQTWSQQEKFRASLELKVWNCWALRKSSGDLPLPSPLPLPLAKSSMTKVGRGDEVAQTTVEE